MWSLHPTEPAALAWLGEQMTLAWQRGRWLAHYGSGRVRVFGLALPLWWARVESRQYGPTAISDQVNGWLRGEDEEAMSPAQRRRLESAVAAKLQEPAMRRQLLTALDLGSEEGRPWVDDAAEKLVAVMVRELQQREQP